MAMIAATPSVPYGSVMPKKVKKRLERSNALAGLGLELSTVDMLNPYGTGGGSTPTFSINSVATPTPPPSPDNSWGDVSKDLVLGWSATGQQILLNKNQPTLYQTGPGGTTVYAPTAGGSYFPGGGGSILGGGSSMTTMLMIGGAVLAVVLLMKNRG